MSPAPYPVLEPTTLKCHRQPLGVGWRVWTKRWVFEDISLEGAQRKALEVFPKALFIVHFPDPKPHRPRKRRRKTRGELA